MSRAVLPRNEHHQTKFQTESAINRELLHLISSQNSGRLCTIFFLWQALHHQVFVFCTMKGKRISVLVRFSPPSMTADQYDTILDRLYKEGIHPADGLELEVCFGSGD